MDTMKINTGFMQNLIAKIIKKTIQKKLGVDVDVRFNGPISVEINDNQATVDLGITASMPKEDLTKLLKDLV